MLAASISSTDAVDQGVEVFYFPTAYTKGGG